MDQDHIDNLLPQLTNLPIINDANLPESLVNHDDVILAIRTINTIRTAYNHPLNIHAYEIINDNIDEWTDRYNVEDWTDDDWIAFIHYVEEHVPEYNEFNLKCYGIYIDNDWLYDILQTDTETIDLLYFSAIPYRYNNHYTCFDLVLNHLLDMNLITPRDVYDIMIGITMVSNMNLFDILMTNNRILQIVDFNHIPRIIYQQMIEISRNEFAQVLDNFYQYHFHIPNDYDLIPTIIMNILNIDTCVQIIRRLIQGGHLYDRNGCLQIAFLISQTQQNMDLYNALMHVL
jgi:hypothetical protein